MKYINATLITTAISGALALGMYAGSSSAAEKVEMEKCYGVVKAGKNDCQTAASSCAGTSKKDGQKDAWILIPKGTCEKIVGGSLASAKK
jgi:uncharacterized membrane protein